MILQQSIDPSFSEQTLNFFINLVSNPTLLAQGYELIKHFLLFNEQNRISTLLNLVNQNVPVLTLISNVFATQVMPLLNPIQANNSRQIIMNVLIKCLLTNPAIETKQNAQLLNFLTKIHNVQGYQNWTELYNRLLNSLIECKFENCPKLLIQILKEADDRIAPLAINIFKEIMKNSFNNTVEQYLQQIYYCVKHMAHLYETDDGKLQQLLNEFIPSIIECVLINMKTSPVAMRFSFKILTVLFSDYEVECRPDLLMEVQNTIKLLLAEYIKWINQMTETEIWQEDGSDLNDHSLEAIMYQGIQLLQSLQEVQLDPYLIIYLPIIGTYFSVGAYSQNLRCTDSYFMQVQDQSQTTLRNRCILFIDQLLQNKQTSRKILPILQHYIHTIFHIQKNAANILTMLFSNAQINPILLVNTNIYIESAFFIFYSFTDKLVIDLQSTVLLLGNYAKFASFLQIQSILAILIMNKLVLKMNNQAQEGYYGFLRQMLNIHPTDIGLILSCFRGLCKKEILIEKDIQSAVVNLTYYILKNDSAQNESAYLVLEILLKFSLKNENLTFLRQLLPYQKQIQLINWYSHDGMMGSILASFLAVIAQTPTINAVWQQLLRGNTKQEGLFLLVGKWIKHHKLVINEVSMLQFIQIYAKKIQEVSQIIKSFLQQSTVLNPNLIQVLNSVLQPSWMLPLLKNNLLLDINKHFLTSVAAIVQSLTSPTEIQNRLFLPYYLLLTQTQKALQQLQKANLIQHFMNKLCKYAKLFQGKNLKIMTCHVLLKICAICAPLRKQLLQIVASFGQIQTEEWEDEDQQESIASLINRFQSNMINEEVETLFKDAFGDLVWQTQEIQNKFRQISSLT